MSTKEAQEKIVVNMRKWQEIEDAAVYSTGQVIARTQNPVVRLVMEIIQRDSQMHHRVQELVADSLEGKATLTLTPEDVGDVWGVIEEHIELERKTIELGKMCLEAIKGKKGMVIQEFLLKYLLTDEEKHDAILTNLEEIKKNM